MVQDDHSSVVLSYRPDPSDDGRIAAGDRCQVGVFQRVLIDRVLGLINRRCRLDGELDDDVLSAAESACDAAGVVRVEYDLAIFSVKLVVALVAGHVLDGESSADLDALDGTDAQHAAQFRVQLVKDGFAQSDGDACYADFDDAAGGIAGFW